MSMASDAKEAAILQMMSGFPSSSKVTDATVEAYLAAVQDIGEDAVKRSCTQFSRGLVENRNNAFMPTAAELAANARLWQDAIAQVEASAALKKAQRITSYPIGTLPKPPSEPLGPIKMEVEGILRDTSDWTWAQKDEAMRTGKMPVSRTPDGIAAPPSTPRIEARVRKMNE